MTNSATSQARPGKRERLIASAAELLHQHGAAGPTLAEIAHAADVPPGNVYYYFKTRDELVQAVIESRMDQVRALLASLDDRPTPVAKLKGLAESWTANAQMVVDYGCPLGGLCQELGKTNPELGEDAARPLRVLLEWVERQFRELGQRNASALAVTFLGAIQGAALLASALADEKLLRQEIRRIERWVESLA
jgi:TetR/AcrR family transcriptional repressor of nem operon